MNIRLLLGLLPALLLFTSCRTSSSSNSTAHCNELEHGLGLVEERP